jgi:hypothetical protein
MKKEYTEIKEDEKRKSIKYETLTHIKNNKTILKSVTNLKLCKNLLHSNLGHI